MADSNERINYEFTVDSADAIKNLSAFDQNISNLLKTSDGTKGALEKLGNTFKNLAGEMHLSEEASKRFLAAVNAQLDPARQLTSTFNGMVKALTNAGNANREFTLKAERIDLAIKRNEESAREFSRTLQQTIREDLAAKDQALRKEQEIQEEIEKTIEASNRAKLANQKRFQNYNNASPKGQINVDPATKSAQSSAVDFIKFFRELDKTAQQTAGNVQSSFSTISKSAEESAKVFQQFDNRSALDKLKDTAAMFKTTLPKSTKKFEDALRSTSGALKSVGSHIADAGRRLQSFVAVTNLATRSSGMFKHALRDISAVAFGKAIGKGIKNAIDYQETLNLFTVAMGNSIDQGNKFIHTMSEMYGLDPKSLMQYTGMFYEMAYAVSVPDDASRKLSTSLTALSADMASLFNVPVEKVSENMISGMRGMSRAVVKYGLDLRASTVEAYANSIGITQQYETMNEASREILRYIVAVKQASDAQGDFAETITQPANQLRILKEQIIQLGRAIGSFFIAPLKAVLPVINGVVMAVRILIETIGLLTGLVKPNETDRVIDKGDKITEGIGGIGTAADKTKKKVKALLAPFDELNILQENQASSSSSGGGVGGGYGEIDPKILAALDATEYKLTNVRLKALDTRDAILAFFGVTPKGDSWVYSPDVFEANLKAKLPNWTQSIEAAFNINFGLLKTNFMLTLEELKDIALMAFSTLATDIAHLFGINLTDESLAEWLNNLNTNLENFRQKLYENEDTLATLLARLLEFKILLTVLGKLATPLFNLMLFGGPIISGLGTVFGLLATPLGKAVGLFGKLGAVITTKLFDVVMNGATTMTKFGGALGTGNTAIATMLKSLGGLIATFSGPLTVAIGALLAVGAGLFIGGFIKWAKESDSFQEHLSKWKDSLGNIFKGLGDIVSAVFDGIKSGIDFCAEHFDWLYDAIAQTITSTLKVLEGLIDFVAGVFTGDWKRAWEGIKKIFKGTFDAFKTIIKLPLNAVIGIINAALSGVNNAFNSIKRIINRLDIHIPEWIPVLGGKRWSPNLQMSTAPQIAYLAQGGVVRKPTPAMIGEGRYDEAVIPLGNSPQMADLAQRVAIAASGDNDRVVAAINNLIDAVLSKETVVTIGDTEIGESYDRYNQHRGVRVNTGAFANAY